MINPNNPQHRDRMARSAEYAFTELTRFNSMRANTVRAYLGIAPSGCNDWNWADETTESKYLENLPKGNLLQMSALGTQIALAYGEPQWLATARMPENIGTAESMEPGLNRMSLLLNLGETARNVAADSFFGYGIFKVGIGRLPLSAQVATGLRYGPCVWRVGQPNFLYDTTVASWDECAFIGDLYLMPLNEAQELYPNDADRLAEITDDMYRMDSARVMARPTRYASPEPMVQMFDCQIPGTKVVGTWPIRAYNMRSIAEPALTLRDYNGHWSGVYQVLSHLYSPDELVPIAQAESTKALHFLFNDILALTSEQARHAKVNPTYQAAAEKDMKKLWDAADRAPVAVMDPTRFGQWEVPGPTQSQTAYMAAIMALFKQMSFNLDAQLGLAPTSGTATQSTLINNRTDALIAEARRKFLRVMQLVGYKLGHLMMKDQNLYLPLHRQLAPGSKITIDVSWQPAARRPSNAIVDDFDINVEPISLKNRSGEERLQQIAQISNSIILPALSAQANGLPISAERVIETAAKYSANPELRDWYEPVDPVYQQQKQESRFNSQRPDIGHYVRENVSTKTDQSGITEALDTLAKDVGVHHLNTQPPGLAQGVV